MSETVIVTNSSGTGEEFDSEDQYTDETQGFVGDLTSEWEPLNEKAISPDGTIPLRLIRPGWGSSGYYPKEVLRRDGPTVFKSGTHMFWNHQTSAQERERPEGDLRDLAAVLVTNAEYKEDGLHGPGLYAKAKVFSQYKNAVEELAPHIGVSIRAIGKASDKPMESEGRRGRAIIELASARSVDFVTQPGAGGKVLEMFESARSGAQPTPPLKEAQQMDEKKKDTGAQEEDRIKILEAEVAALQATIAERDETIATYAREAADHRVRELVVESVGATKLPELTTKRLVDTLIAAPVMVEGSLDEDAFVTKIKETIKAAETEIASITTNKVTGMGAPSSSTATLKEEYKKTYQARGVDEETASKLADIAASGR